MKKVNDLNHFSTLVKSIKQDGKQVHTNCYLMPDTITRYIQRNRIFWEANANGVVFLCEEMDFYYLYFYISEPLQFDTPVQFEPLDKPIVIDLAGTEAQWLHSLVKVEEFWITHGFKHYKNYKRLSLDLPLGDRRSIYQLDLDTTLYKLAYAQPSDIQDLYDLWRNTLDIYSTPLPDDDEMHELVNNMHILCVFTKENKLAGATVQKINGKTCFIWHMAVSEEHRRRGLAMALLVYSILENSHVQRYYVWVYERNTSVINLDLAVGFRFDGKVTHQLILKQ